MIPHSWFLESLELMQVFENIIQFIRELFQIIWQRLI